jgi:OOP family OmpA-OmpF porin
MDDFNIGIVQMLKKGLRTAVLSVSVIGVMAAHAAAPGVYLTGQLGYVNTHMKGKQKKFEIPVNSPSLTNNGSAGRFSIGYQLNQNWALELGYLLLNQGKVHVPNVMPFVPGIYSLREDVIDILGKAILPLKPNLNVYGKLGLAYITSNIWFTATDRPEFNGNANDNFTIPKYQWAPEVAVGVSYDIAPNVSIDASWAHIQPPGNTNRPGNIDFFAAGVGYHFG